jgi:hypothetical protein
MGRRGPWALSGLALGLGLHAIAPLVGQAATPATAPSGVVNTLGAIEAAANAQDLEGVMAYYSEDFDSDTGFDHGQLRQTLAALWDQYSDLTYDVELLSWEAAGPNRYTIETRTRVSGRQVRPERELTLAAEVTSRQQLENGQIAHQEVLSETSRLTSGSTPPSVLIQLPATLSPGQTYPFDTIVLEPLAGRSLMGVAIDEGVTSEDFMEPRPVVLDVLSAGGLYKIGTASDQADQRWISTVIVREDGMVVETRRVQVQAD